MQIVVVTNRADLHADIVIEKIQKRGGNVFRLNLDSFPRDYELSIQNGLGVWVGEIRNQVTGEKLQFEKVGSFWLRKRGAFSYGEALSKQEHIFANNEIDQILLGLFHSIECFWMSSPSSIRRAQWKLEQLQRAQKFGFTIPASLVTSSPHVVREFRSGCRYGTIFKALSSASLSSNLVNGSEVDAVGLSTTLLSDEHDCMLGALCVTAGFFQEYVPKAVELRVTVVGHTAFVAEIHSQEDARTLIDFRDFSAEIKYDVGVLPTKVEQSCIEFVRSYGLEFGALDLIVKPDGEFVFLENNPVGQFYFVEQLVPSLAISDALADVLINEAREAAR